jgi:hypothetical protein
MPIRKIIIIWAIVGILLPSFAFVQTQPVSPPETLEEVKEIGKKIEKEIPKMLEKVWKEEILPIWQKIYNWLKKTFWDPYLGPFFKREIEKRKPIIEEEFKKEKEEMKEELPRVGKSLWERFKELIK